MPPRPALTLDSCRVQLLPLPIDSPDWVLEIVSNSSVAKDTRDLRQAYHRARIREYWLVDARGEDIHFQILHWRKTGYVAAPREAGWQRSRVFARWFQLTRCRDRRGGWSRYP
jgi:Uma2 family endonuclease